MPTKYEQPDKKKEHRRRNEGRRKDQEQGNPEGGSAALLSPFLRPSVFLRFSRHLPFFVRLLVFRWHVPCTRASFMPKIWHRPCVRASSMPICHNARVRYLRGYIHTPTMYIQPRGRGWHRAIRKGRRPLVGCHVTRRPRLGCRWAIRIGRRPPVGCHVTRRPRLGRLGQSGKAGGRSSAAT